MTAPSTHPVEILFARAQGGRIRIDGLSGGRRCRGQGEAYDSASIIAAMTNPPPVGASLDRDALARAGFTPAPANGQDGLRYVRPTELGSYTLTLRSAALDLAFAAWGEPGQPVTLVQLKRGDDGALWPDDCASEAAHIAVALAVMAHHAGRGAAH